MSGIDFTNAIIPITITIALTFAIVIYFWFKRETGPRKSVLLLRPRDKRGMEIPIKRETDIGLECTKTGGITRRFIKAGPGWTFPTGTKFLGIEGTAYTAIIPTGQKDAKSVTLKDGLKFLWGETVYNKMPLVLKEKIENHLFGMTIQPDRPPDENLPKLSSEDVHEHDDNTMLSIFAKNAQQANKTNYWNILMGVALGGFLVYILANVHWLPVAK